MHPIVVYDIHRLEHRQRLAELTHRRTILRELRIRKIIAQLTRGGRSTGRLFAVQGTVAEQQEENPDYIRAS
ncbi:hypothetical protein [Ruania alba]|uniref:Uncharacterized protein n=1 Tax=Ruania alba TaxID=648782 RepID=A0A1H5DIH7_9MICO|nr:hypothetical protein [Ruania alba]SED78570.1 hypothetical protein SAMN04488554_0689 [Ruania alba]